MSRIILGLDPVSLPPVEQITTIAPQWKVVVTNDPDVPLGHIFTARIDPANSNLILEYSDISAGSFGYSEYDKGEEINNWNNWGRHVYFVRDEYGEHLSVVNNKLTYEMEPVV